MASFTCLATVDSTDPEFKAKKTPFRTGSERGKRGSTMKTVYFYFFNFFFGRRFTGLLYEKRLLYDENITNNIGSMSLNIGENL